MRGVWWFCALRSMFHRSGPGRRPAQGPKGPSSTSRPGYGRMVTGRVAGWSGHPDGRLDVRPDQRIHQLERHGQEDIAFRILNGNRAPNHLTIARFRVRHEQALAALLVASPKLCAAAGMVRLGLVFLDGTRVAANAAAAANRSHARLIAQVAELPQQAADTDRAEDQTAPVGAGRAAH
jgi:hypothetical protein